MRTNLDSLKAIMNDRKKIYEDIKRLDFRVRSYGTQQQIFFHDEYLRDFLFAYKLIEDKETQLKKLNSSNSNNLEIFDLFFLLRDVYFQKMRTLSGINNQIYRSHLKMPLNQNLKKLMEERNRLDSLMFKSIQ
ncbi:hypothetical protein [Aquimarina longa]|uniref:hypothetical protein n=1 Tax=Aquimarina longa TaxID=1080221 RepID=UPI000782336F|nr:hypothetical protein [Aquimarina longa]